MKTILCLVFILSFSAMSSELSICKGFQDDIVKIVNVNVDKGSNLVNVVWENGDEASYTILSVDDIHYRDATKRYLTQYYDGTVPGVNTQEVPLMVYEHPNFSSDDFGSLAFRATEYGKISLFYMLVCGDN